MQNRHKTYRSRKTVKTVFFIAIVSILSLSIMLTAMFFGFRKYIVYTENGIHLEIPWLEKSNENVTILPER